MAKPSKKKHDGKSIKITTKNIFGTSPEDVVKELENGKVLCKDQHGEYVTDKKRVGDGLGNPDRWDRVQNFVNLEVLEDSTIFSMKELFQNQ